MKDKIKRYIVNHINAKINAYFDVDIDVNLLTSDGEDIIRFAVEWDDDMDKDEVVEVLSIFLRNAGVLSLESEDFGHKYFALKVTNEYYLKY